MRRREFIRVVGLSTSWPLMVNAQQTASSARIAKIGVLWQADSADELVKIYRGILTKALSGLGYVEGKTAQFLHCSSTEPLRLRELVRELVDNAPDVIIATTHLCAIEARQATATIPIVLVLVANPVGSGLIESLAHPGGNITGLSLMSDDMTSKRLGFFKEAVPTLRRVALLSFPKDATYASNLSSNANAAKAFGLELRPVDIPSPDEIAQTFSTIAKDGFDGAILVGAIVILERARIGASALAEKMPTIAFAAEMVPYGLLMSYGVDYSEYFRKSAVYVDKILKGAKPADLPVEQPTRFKLVVNLKVAKALGLNIPPTLLTAADEVIE